MQQLVVGYVGNFRPEHSTENHVGQALADLGHQVVQLQEDDGDTWQLLTDPDAILDRQLDLVLWTRTWHLPDFPQREALKVLDELGVGTVAYHLDRWWGLDREHQVRDEPMFSCRLVVTADGDPRHQQRFRDAGVDHLWFPPGVSHVEATRPAFVQRHFAQRPVAFVGSWQQYHAEWPHRRELITHLRRHYQGRLGLWPKNHGIRGQELVDLYASVKVVVGDSCLAGGITHYWSDRIPETLGRGGFLIHPHVEGLSEHFTPGEHLVTFPAGDWRELDRLIDHYLRHDDERERIAQAGKAHVLAHHTYKVRMADLLDVCRRRKLIRTVAGQSGVVRVSGPNGTRGVFALREGSTDGLVVDEVWREDVYQLNHLDVTGGVVVDVGANVGAFAVWAGAAGAAQVHAYEPELSNFHRLQDNVAANGLEQVVDCRRVAVWGDQADHVWVAGVQQGAEGDVRTSVDAPSALSGPEDEVPAWGLSFVLRRAGDRIRLVKLDCEGCEWPAWATMDPQDLARVDQLVMEFHGAGMGVEGAWFGELVEVLAEWGTVTVVGRPSAGGTLWWRRY